MKWKGRPDGYVKKRKVFLLFPTHFPNQNLTVWLEWIWRESTYKSRGGWIGRWTHRYSSINKE